MVKVLSGKKPDGRPNLHYIDGYMQKNLDRVIEWVTKKNYDYVSLVCGLPGVGKSNFAQGIARYCDHTFDEKKIAFTDEDFIQITNNVPEYSSVILDESFSSLNARVSNSSQFLRILNHIQLIRQKHLFVFLCLPNYFDLQKGVAIGRASHLFLVYNDQDTGARGKFAAFDRTSKRELYIQGSKFMNYDCVQPNFRGRFTKQTGISDAKYEVMKRQHLMDQGNKIVKGSKVKQQRDSFVVNLNKLKWKKQDIADAGLMSRRSVYDVLKEG